MKRGRLRRVLVTALMAALFAILNIGTAFCAVQVDVDRESSLSLEYQYNGAALPGVSFSLYRVADLSAAADLTLSGAFAGYRVSLENLDDSGWKTAAGTLASYVRADSIQPDRSGVTDESGRIGFGVLSTGLYLLIGQDSVSGRQTFKAAPFLVSLPGLLEDDTWNYEVAVRPKVSVTTRPSGNSGGSSPGGDQEKITVIKVWNDDGHGSARPERIKVTLLKDGQEYRSVVLSSGNRWRHTWSGLDTGYTWDVIEEEVAEHYTVTYSREGSVATITNTVEDVPKGQLLPPVEIPGPEVPLIRLHQTGLLQWPIPILGIIGMVLFAFGWKDYYRK